MARRSPHSLSLLIVIVLAAGAYLFLKDGFQPAAEAPPDRTATTTPATGDGEPTTADVAMALCHGWPRVNCVIDGDTFWYRGHKVRISDINAPETHEAQCNYEAELGKRATDRLIVLLNEGPFELVRTDSRDEDSYGRKLRVVEREGRSLGQQLVAEGLAERWQGWRRDWCRG